MAAAVVATGSQPTVTILLTPAMGELHAHELRRYLQLLGPEEAQRWQGLKGRRQLQYLVGRAALRILLSDCHPRKSAQEWVVREQVDRAPEVLGARAAGLHYSISHSGDFVAVAVCTSMPVGVDIECHKPRDFVGIARQWFHPGEARLMGAVEGEKRLHTFYQLWTLKEARIKLGQASIFGDGLKNIQPRPHKADPGQGSPGVQSNRAFVGAAAFFDTYSLAIVAARPFEIQALLGFPLLHQRSISPSFQAFTLPDPGPP